MGSMTRRIRSQVHFREHKEPPRQTRERLIAESRTAKRAAQARAKESGER